MLRTAAVAWEQHMNHTSIADKREQKHLRHSHQHLSLINVNQALVETLTPGERVADSLAIVMGSWTFMADLVRRGL
jgi:uncharacterized membrane protein